MMRFPAYSLIFVLAPVTCFGASPESFFGTYQTGMDCRISFLVIDEENVSMDGCKELPYKVIDRADHQIALDVAPSKGCARKIMKLETKELPLKVEGKRPRSNVPTYTSFILSLYENHENLSVNKPMETRTYRKVDPSMAEDQIVLFRNGKTNQQRKQALHEINLQCYEERDEYNEIGLRDPSPDVRDIAVWFLRGEPNHFVPLVVDVMVNDPDAKVRASAGFALNHFYTDNGSDGYLYTKPLEEDLGTLLSGLKNVETLRSIVGILGSRYTGDSVAPCYMSADNRRKVLGALGDQLNTIQLAAEAFGKGSNATWHNEWSEARNEITDAIEEITKCNPAR